MIDRKRVILYIMSCVQQEHKTIRNARVAQLVERDLAKVEAAGSSPVSRSFHAKGLWKKNSPTKKKDQEFIMNSRSFFLL